MAAGESIRRPTRTRSGGSTRRENLPNRIPGNLTDQHDTGCSAASLGAPSRKLSERLSEIKAGSHSMPRFPASRRALGMDPISYFQAIVLGLLQGVSELFPISSL